jgi:glycosyltransferase involved in cell wall biosynthesis
MPFEPTPPLSVIIPTRNRVKSLERSLDSLFKCIDSELPNTEVIVIDGGSTDGTVELLRRYGSRIAYWVSEFDSGVAEAFNKGLAKATAPIIRVLGDDDEVLPEGLALFVRILKERPEYDIVAGHNAPWFEEPDGSKVKIWQERFCGEVGWQDFQKYGRPKFLIPEVCFIRKSLYEKVGGYDTSLRWFGFLDHFYRALSAGARIFVVPVPILITYQTWQSDTRVNIANPAFKGEYLGVIRKHVGPMWGAWHYFDGTLNPVKLLKRWGFHPRRVYGHISSAAKNALTKTTH